MLDPSRLAIVSAERRVVVVADDESDAPSRPHVGPGQPTSTALRTGGRDLGHCDEARGGQVYHLAQLVLRLAVLELQAQPVPSYVRTRACSTVHS